MNRLHCALAFTACAALACASNAQEGNRADGDGGGNLGSSTGTGAQGPADGEGLTSDATCAPDAIVALPAGHRMASALYAISALEAGIPPDPALLRRDDFQRYFAPPPGSTPGSYGRFTANGISTDGMPQALLEAGVVSAAPATPTPVHLIAVVDESSSMREEIALAADLVEQMTLPGALGSAKDDRLTVIEWTDQPVALLTNASAKDGVFDTTAPVADLRKRATGQLAGAPSFEQLRAVVGDAIDASEATPHVVVLTDGGFDLDTTAIATLEGWSARGAIASVVELHGLAEISDDAMPYHPELGAAFSGGLDLFIGARAGLVPTDEAVVFHDSFAQLFRPSTQRAVASLAAPGFRFEAFDAAGTPGDGSVRVAWIGDGGFTPVRASMIACSDAFPDKAVVEAGAGEGDPDRAAFTAFRLDVPPPDPQSLSEARTLRMSFVDRLVSVLESKCDLSQASPYALLVADLDTTMQANGLDGDALAEHQVIVGRMQHWLGLYPSACQ